MVISNGFISLTKTEAYREVCRRCSSRVLPVPLPTIDTMTYWLSEDGEIYGCQQYKSFVLTKQLKIERRYKRGCSIRYAIGDSKQSNAYMQNIMYATFVSHEYIETQNFEFKDNNQYNYHLSNITPKKAHVTPSEYNNLHELKDVYKKNFNKVVRRINLRYTTLSEEDCKDIASEAFYYLCKCRRYKPSYFLGIWIHIALRRAIDFLHIHARHYTLLDNDIDEDNFDWWHDIDNIDKEKIFDTIKSERARYIIQRYIEGYTIQEIATDTQMASSSVSCSLSRSIKKLRDIYAR